MTRVSLLLLLVGSVIAQDNLCNPSPCGENSECSVEGGRAVCGCLKGYIGNPLQKCRRECEKDDDCAENLGCMNYRCRDPCKSGGGGCGDYATCQIQNHQAICTCPDSYGGDPYQQCIPECQSTADCPSHLACIGYHCGNPCIEGNPCKARNSDCRVERHTVVCFCKQGYYGEPLTTGCSRTSG